MAEDEIRPRREDFSPLDQHHRRGKVLTPPLMRIPGITPQSWLNDRLPDMLWAALLTQALPRDQYIRHLSLVAKAAMRFRDNADAYPQHTTVARLSRDHSPPCLAICWRMSRHVALSRSSCSMAFRIERIGNPASRPPIRKQDGQRSPPQWHSAWTAGGDVRSTYDGCASCSWGFNIVCCSRRANATVSSKCFAPTRNWPIRAARRTH